MTAIADLRTRLRGPLLLPDENGYDDARSIWNAMIDRRPAAIAVLNIAGAWEKAEDDAANLEWARSTWRDMRRFSTGGTYVNFLTEEEGTERLRAAYGRHYDKLVEIKKAWDPGNLFRANKNIPPR